MRLPLYAGRIALVSLLLLLASRPAVSQDAVDLGTLSADQWRADLRELADQMPKVHANLFHTMSRAQFTAAVADLDQRTPHSNTDEILVGFSRVTALVQDGHSGAILPLAFAAQTSYPLQLAWYENGIFVQRAPRAYASLVGGRVVRIGTATAERALAEITTIVPHDASNDGLVRAHGVPAYLTSPRVLHGLGFTPTAQEATFTVEREGRQVSVVVHPAPRQPAMNGAPAGHAAPDATDPNLVDAANAPVGPLPASQQQPGKQLWFTYVAPQRAVYVQFNAVQNGQDETLAAFFGRVFDFVDKNDVDRVIIDLRNNGGGNNTLLRPLLVDVIQAKKIDRRGHLFALIGPTTFSAAQNFANRLELYTETIFIGTPTAENVNFYGDTRPIVLPNSTLRIGMSALYWQDQDPRDKRTSLSPEIAVTPTFDAYRKHTDPALQEALTGSFPTLGEAVRGALPHGYAAVLEAARAWAGDPRHRYVANTEARMNALGYAVLNEKRFDDAIAVFRATAEMHPTSANAFDSLGEAYALAGRRAEAVAAYERALQLDPSSAGARAALARLRG